MQPCLTFRKPLHTCLFLRRSAWISWLESASIRRTSCWVNAADAGCVARGRCELVCAFTPSDRKIGYTVRSTCVYSVKLSVCALWRLTPKDRKIGRTVSSFEVLYFELLDPEILSASSSILRPLKFLHSCAKNLRTYRVVVRIFRNILFIASSCWILKI